jgi:hypothetical protein
MSKFNRAASNAAARPEVDEATNVVVTAVGTAKSPIKTRKTVTGVTGQGAPGYEHGDKSALFLLAVTNMVSEDTFYEKAGDRDERFENLVTRVAIKDPEWIIGFFGWLRSEANMRSASLVGALVAAQAMVMVGVPGARQMVTSVLQRADEPGEALAYWIKMFGRNIPKPVKRGIADAATRLYNEYTTLKYDTASHAVRFGDVLDLTHPKATAQWQANLYRYVLAMRHNRDEIPEVGPGLPMILANHALRSAGAELPELLLNSEHLRRAGMTWEDALSLVGSKVDKGKLWEAMIPSMGYMALLRNLRNFDKANVSDEVAQQVIERLSDPAQVARSRQFPFRFLAAYRATAGTSVRWAAALEKALSASVSNIPELPGRTLVLVDRSGSMFMPMSGRTELDRSDAAAVFGGAVALRNAGRVTLVQFDDSSREIPVPTGRGSLLKLVEKFTGGGGTSTAAAVRKHFNGHDRVIIVTDEQSNGGDPSGVIPKNVPLYTWNLAGYQFTGTSGGSKRHTFGGLTDSAFKLIPMLEAGVDQGWPWEVDAG